MIEKIQPFAIALALGLLIGIERERSHPPGIQASGLRTFVLFSLLGAVVAAVQQPLVAFSITLFVGAIVVTSYFRSTREAGKDSYGIGITTEVAAVMTYMLGLMAGVDPSVTLIIGLATIVVLLAKEHLHKFSREKLRKEEFQATVSILILGLGIIPLLPNNLVDPWRLFNPQRFGVIFMTILIMQFAAYVIARLFGGKRSIIFSGLLSGLISSAVATFSYVEQARRGELDPKSAAAAIVYATIAMYLKLALIVEFVIPRLSYEIFWPILVACFIGLAYAVRITRSIDTQPKEEVATLQNPLALWPALKIAMMLVAMLITITVGGRALGLTATHVVSFLGGLFDIHSVAFAVASLYRRGELGLNPALLSMSFAIIASFISKLAMISSAVQQQRTFVGYAVLGQMIMLLSTIVIWALMLKA